MRRNAFSSSTTEKNGTISRRAPSSSAEKPRIASVAQEAPWMEPSENGTGAMT